MQEIYQYENRLIKELEKYYPEVVSRLNYPGDVESIKKIEEEIGEELPESLKKLYQEFDGEDKNLYVGVILGFSLLSAVEMLEEIHLLKENSADVIMESMSGEAISEEEIGKRIIIPFAFDASHCYIALDLTPGQKGKKGQVITLDFDYDSSFLLADSLEEFYDFIIKMMEEKKCQVQIGEEDEEYFEFESGHFFNNLEELLADINKKKEEIKEYQNEKDAKERGIILPKEFWQEYYKKESITVSELAAKEELEICYDGENLSLMPLQYMENLEELSLDFYDENCSLIPLQYVKTLKELSICFRGQSISLKPLQYLKNIERIKLTIAWNAKIEDFEAVAAMTELTEFHLNYEKLESQQLTILNQLPKLIEVSLYNIDLRNIGSLASSKTIRSLRLGFITNIDTNGLAGFTELQELDIFEVKLENVEFLKHMKNLEILCLDRTPIDNLDFLEYTTQLKEFEMEYKAKDESGLRFLPDLKKIKVLKYPVADLSLYDGLEELRTIGVDVRNVCNFECLKNISMYLDENSGYEKEKQFYVTLYDVKSEEEAEQIFSEIEKYIKISYGGHSHYFLPDDEENNEVKEYIWQEDMERVSYSLEEDEKKEDTEEACFDDINQNKPFINPILEEKLEEEQILYYAGNHIGFFLAWIIKHDFIGGIHQQNKEAIKAVKEEKMSGVDFLLQYCDGKFRKADVAEEILPFVEKYYCTIYKLNRSASITYLRHYVIWLGQKQGKPLFEFIGTWEDYHDFEHILDMAYQDFQKGEEFKFYDNI